jgi:hypothetical protein
MMISIKVSKKYKNDKLIDLLQKDDININQTILDFGVSLYNNQSDIVKYYSIDSEIKLKNDELDSLKNEIKKIIKSYDETIKSLKNDKDKEYEQYKLNKEKEINDLLLEKRSYENNLHLNFKLKENELNNIITKLNEDKDNIFEKYLEDKRNLEKTYRETFFKKENDYDTIINNIQNEKLTIREQYFKDIKDIELKLNNQYQDKINSLEFNIEKLQNEKVINISSLIEQGKKLSQDDYDKYIKLHELHNNQLKTNYENQIKDINDKNNKLIDKINDLDILITNLHSNNNELTNKLFDISKMQENNKYDSLINNFSVLNQKLGDNFDRFFRDNTSKGIIGEDFIEKFLSDSFSNCKIFNFTKEFGKGDFLFVLNDSKILIESKNVQTLKKEDIDKFYRDIDIQIAKNTINSAILISLNDTNLINGKRLFHIEIKNSIPIIMISNAFKMTEYIRFSILIINYLIKIGICNNNESDDEKLSFIINSINEIYCFFKIQINYLNNDKQMLLKIEQSYNKREVDLFNIEKLMKNIFSKYPEMYIKDTVSNNNDNLETIINKIDQHINTLEPNTEFKITTKNLEEIGILKNMIRNIGGLKVLTEHFNKK